MGQKKFGSKKIWVKKKFGSKQKLGQIFFLHFSNIGVKLRLDAENQVPTCPGSGLKVCGGGGGWVGW